MLSRLGLLWAVLTVAAVLTAGGAAAEPALTTTATTADATGQTWASPREPDADPPVWPFAAGTVAAVGVAALWATRRRP